MFRGPGFAHTRIAMAPPPITAQTMKNAARVLLMVVIFITLVNIVKNVLDMDDVIQTPPPAAKARIPTTPHPQAIHIYVHSVPNAPNAPHQQPPISALHSPGSGSAVGSSSIASPTAPTTTSAVPIYYAIPAIHNGGYVLVM
jgi:hypothetical protein